MAANLLKRTGEALYGPQWQSAVARDLGMSDRHMRRMVAGEVALKPGTALDLWRVTLERIGELESLAEELKLAAGP